MRKWAILFVFTSLLITSCGIVGKRIKGNGQVTTENRTPGSFVGVISYGSFNVFVSMGSATTVKIEAESNILPYIETNIGDDNNLVVRSKKGTWLSTNKPVNVYITAPRFGKIHSNGDGDIIGQTAITDSSKLDLKIGGNGHVNLDVDAPEVVAVLTGNGGIQLKGQSKSFNCRLTGNGSVKAFDLMTEDTKVNIIGNGDAEVHASLKLDVSIGGNGNVRYKGAAELATHITGNGNIKQVH